MPIFYKSKSQNTTNVIVRNEFNKPILKHPHYLASGTSHSGKHCFFSHLSFLMTLLNEYLILFLCIFETQLTYNIMFILGVQHNDICIYYKMITTINLVNNHHHTLLQIFFLAMRLLRSTLLATFTHTIWKLTMWVDCLPQSPCYKSHPQELFILWLEVFHLLTLFTHFTHLPSLASGNRSTYIS